MQYFGPVGAIGADRRVNRFEIAGDMELADLRAVFQGLDYHSVYYSGVAFVLTTATTVTSHDVMHRILEAGLPVGYFRDISRSAKNILQDDGPGQ